MNLVKQENNGQRSPRNQQNPFGRFRDLNEMFDHFWRDEIPERAGNFIPAVNISEERDLYCIEVSAPGFSKESLDIAVDNNVLTISAEKSAEKESKERKFSRREFSYGSFRRTFTLPDSVEVDQISCNYRDGILNVTLPKREEAKPRPPRKIDIE